MTFWHAAFCLGVSVAFCTGYLLGAFFVAKSLLSEELEIARDERKRLQAVRHAMRGMH